MTLQERQKDDKEALCGILSLFWVNRSTPTWFCWVMFDYCYAKMRLLGYLVIFSRHRRQIQAFLPALQDTLIDLEFSSKPFDIPTGVRPKNARGVDFFGKNTLMSDI